MSKAKNLASIQVLIALSAVCLSGVSTWMLNISVYPQLALSFGAAREIATGMSGALSLVLVVIASRKPNLLGKTLPTAISVCSQLVAMILIPLGLGGNADSLVLFGLGLRALATTWLNALICLTLVSLASNRAVMLATAGGAALTEIMKLFPLPQDYFLGSTLMGTAIILAIILCRRISASRLDAVSQGIPASELALSNPESFFSPFHALFLCIFLFRAAYGYGLTLNEVDNTPISTDIVVVFAILITIWLMFGTRKRMEDDLFSFSALCVIAGFSAVPLAFLPDLTLSNLFIRIGVLSFDILCWLIIVSVGKRNLYALLPMTGMIGVFRSIGMDVGTVAGHTSNAYAGTNDQTLALISTTALLIFITFLWVGFRRFSFTETIKGMVEVDVIPTFKTENRFDDRCLNLAKSYRLTERETEILSMLAHGRNGRYIMEHYVISYNTVKTHIKHIYQKMDVHSQLELIRLVEAKPNDTPLP